MRPNEERFECIAKFTTGGGSVSPMAAYEEVSQNLGQFTISDSFRLSGTPSTKILKHSFMHISGVIMIHMYVHCLLSQENDTVVNTLCIVLWLYGMFVDVMVSVCLLLSR